MFKGFRKFSEVWGRVRTCSDLFGCVRIRPDAFGSVRMRSEAFENFHFLFREFVKVFQFSEVFVASGTCFDLFGPARMHSDAIGCIRKRSDGRVRAIYRRSPWCRKSPKSAKCALSRPHITTGFAGNQANTRKTHISVSA